MTLRQTAFRDPRSYFRKFAEISDDEAMEMAEGLWKRINLPNLRDNIVPTRQRADRSSPRAPAIASSRSSCAACERAGDADGDVRDGVHRRHRVSGAIRAGVPRLSPAGGRRPVGTFLTATLGNTLGAVVNWGLGGFWRPVPRAAYRFASGQRPNRLQRGRRLSRAMVGSRCSSRGCRSSAMWRRWRPGHWVIR